MKSSIKPLLLVVIVAGILATELGPGVMATCNYAFRPHSINCQTYSLRVPLGWKLKHGDCSFIAVEKRQNLVPGSDKGTAIFFIRPFAGSDLAREENEFEAAYRSDWHLSKINLGNALNNCDRAELNDGPGWVSIECRNSARKFEFTFLGTETNLAEAANLLH